MRKIFTTVIGMAVIAIAFFSVVALADSYSEQPLPSYSNFNPKFNNLHRQSERMPAIVLYYQPDFHSPVIAEFDYAKRHDLQVFYDRGHWVKVGDQIDGIQGWLNRRQYLNGLKKILEKDYKRRQLAEYQYKQQRMLAKQPNPPLYSNQNNQSYRDDVVVIKRKKRPGKPSKIVVYYNGKRIGEEQSKQMVNIFRQKFYKMRMQALYLNYYVDQFIRQQQRQLAGLLNFANSPMTVMPKLVNPANMKPSSHKGKKKSCGKSKLKHPFNKPKMVNVAMQAPAPLPLYKVVEQKMSPSSNQVITSRFSSIFKDPLLDNNG